MTQGYKVLARTYRPQSFDDLIGQDALVRTLTNAFASGRVAHAYVLTGVRGVGKTTTARILARALNCEKGPTAKPCLVCPQCLAIAEDRHMDVVEIDAASRTGVDAMREILDGTAYRPVFGRDKVYIIDEVHMLSTSAFNALLKTLEEPPDHVRFIFATTEIRKIPATVLSRCQKFDLKRVPADVLEAHFSAIAAKEGADLEPGAAALVAQLADGSVRDGLSLLDQALARGEGKVSADLIRSMLGLTDLSRVFGLLSSALSGPAAEMRKAYLGLLRDGADPTLLAKDLLAATHLSCVAAMAPAALDDPSIPEIERTLARALAGKAGGPRLQSAWQNLMKAVPEMQASPLPGASLEMALLRLVPAKA